MNAGFGEGWGLYSESLGYEFGFYEDPLVRFGMLEGEMFRACRLVVDTGIHAMGWSIKKAVQFLMNHSNYGEPFIRWGGVETLHCHQLYFTFQEADKAVHHYACPGNFLPGKYRFIKLWL